MATWKSYELDMTDYEIFTALKKNPLQSNGDIAKEVKLSAETVRTRIQNMKKRGFLRANRIIQDPVLGERFQTDTEARIHPTKIGLMRQHVFFNSIPDRNSLNLMKIFCDVHPYTHSRVVAYSKNAGLYVQFDIPPEIIKTMSRAYSELLVQGLFRDVQVLNTSIQSICETDLLRWNLENGRWFIESEAKAGQNGSSSIIEKYWSQFNHMSKVFSSRKTELENSVSFDQLDMQLLRELTINSQPNKNQLGEFYKKDPTTIARRIQKLRETVIASDMLYYDRRVFDLTYPQLVSGRLRENTDITEESLHGLVQSGLLPFETRIVSEKRNFLFLTRTPPSLAPEFSEFLWDHCEDMEVYQLQPTGSFQYFFYHENYLGEGKWKTDDDYVLKIPLSALPF